MVKQLWFSDRKTALTCNQNNVTAQQKCGENVPITDQGFMVFFKKNISSIEIVENKKSMHTPAVNYIHCMTE